jgi:hypothetical protein
VPARRDFRRQVEDWHYLEKGSGDSFSTRYFVPNDSVALIPRRC